MTSYKGSIWAKSQRTFATTLPFKRCDHPSESTKNNVQRFCMYHYWVRNWFIFTLLVLFFVKWPLQNSLAHIGQGCLWRILHRGYFKSLWHVFVLTWQHVLQLHLSAYNHCAKNWGMVHLYRCPSPYMVGRKVLSLCLLSRKLRVNLFLHVQCRCLSNMFETKHSDLPSFMLCPVGVFSVWNPQSVLLLVVLVDAAFISYHISFFFSLQRSPFRLQFCLDSNKDSKLAIFVSETQTRLQTYLVRCVLKSASYYWHQITVADSNRARAN